jgi:hypothetical protein
MGDCMSRSCIQTCWPSHLQIRLISQPSHLPYHHAFFIFILIVNLDLGLVIRKEESVFMVIITIVEDDISILVHAMAMLLRFALRFLLERALKPSVFALPKSLHNEETSVSSNGDGSIALPLASKRAIPFLPLSSSSSTSSLVFFFISMGLIYHVTADGQDGQESLSAGVEVTTISEAFHNQSSPQFGFRHPHQSAAP